MSVWFTSDLHLRHARLVEIRGFDTEIDAHDESILDAMGTAVACGDQLWVLGDVTVGGRAAEDWALRELGEFAQKRNVELHLIPGNHDSCHPMANRNSHVRQRAFLDTFASVQLFARRKIAGRTVLLSHFPYTGDHTAEDRGVQYRLQDEGDWLLHGHTHQSGVLDPSVHPRQIHVGWDSWRRPVHVDEVAEIIESGSPTP
ncbi:MAG: metallophosphatase [Rhodococcus sp. (in: high G+C Gram-positive bacteria)]|nr:MAG: metallophosphatase [Rhodococcus sp. (in: high G+C Gram-positive bacteria)]